MNISAHHIQNVIRSYSQRIGRKDQSVQKRPDAAPTSDTVSISDDGKKAQLKAQLTEMISQESTAFKNINNEKKEEAEFAKRLLEKLSGQSEPMLDQKQLTGFKFKIIDATKEEMIKELSLENIKKAIGNIAGETQT